jgi:hypothetical protein
MRPSLRDMAGLWGDIPRRMGWHGTNGGPIVGARLTPVSAGRADFWLLLHPFDFVGDDAVQIFPLFHYLDSRIIFARRPIRFFSLRWASELDFARAVGSLAPPLTRPCAFSCCPISTDASARAYGSKMGLGRSHVRVKWASSS